MSNKTQLQTNNAKYTSLIETLRGKAVDGGGASVETCTVTINFISSGVPNNVWISGTQFIDGSITALSVVDNDGSNSSGVTSPYVITNIVKNSALTISGYGKCQIYSSGASGTGCELLYIAFGTNTCAFKILESSATITISNGY